MALEDISRKYRLIPGTLGHTRTADVLQGLDDDNTIVAIKQKRNASGSLRVEKETLERLANINGVPRCIDHGLFNGKESLVQSKAPGKPLNEWFKEWSTRFNRESIIPQLNEIAINLFSIISNIHTKGIIHLDLKHEHVIVDMPFTMETNVKPLAVTVLDFGHAKTISTSETTITGNPGTEHWRAPEQSLPDMKVSRATDLYSLGKVLLAAIYRCDASALSSAVHQRESGLSHFDAFFAKAFSSDPTKRFQTAEEMQTAWAAAFANHQQPPFASGPRKSSNSGPMNNQQTSIAPQPWWKQKSALAVLVLFALIVLVLLATVIVGGGVLVELRDSHNQHKKETGEQLTELRSSLPPAASAIASALAPLNTKLANIETQQTEAAKKIENLTVKLSDSARSARPAPIPTERTTTKKSHEDEYVMGD